MTGHTVWLGDVCADDERIVCDGANNVTICYDFTETPTGTGDMTRGGGADRREPRARAATAAGRVSRHSLSYGSFFHAPVEIIRGGVSSDSCAHASGQVAKNERTLFARGAFDRMIHRQARFSVSNLSETRSTRRFSKHIPRDPSDTWKDGYFIWHINSWNDELFKDSEPAPDRAFSRAHFDSCGVSLPVCNWCLQLAAFCA